MLSYLVVLGILVLIGLLVAYLFHDTPMVQKILEKRKKYPGEIKKRMGRGKVKIADSPVFFIKAPGETNYEQYSMYRKKTTFGSGKKCDVVLCDDAVEPMHVTVEKLILDNDVCYELVNYSKSNPVEYLNQEKGVYEYLGYKKGIILDVNDAFYIGETKMIVKCPAKHHTISKTERVLSAENIERKESAIDKRETIGIVHEEPRNNSTVATLDAGSIASKIQVMEEVTNLEPQKATVPIAKVASTLRVTNTAPTIRVEKAAPTIRVEKIRRSGNKTEAVAN